MPLPNPRIQKLKHIIHDFNKSLNPTPPVAPEETVVSKRKKLSDFKENQSNALSDCVDIAVDEDILETNKKSESSNIKRYSLSRQHLAPLSNNRSPSTSSIGSNISVEDFSPASDDDKEYKPAESSSSSESSGVVSSNESDSYTKKKLSQKKKSSDSSMSSRSSLHSPIGNNLNNKIKHLSSSSSSDCSNFESVSCNSQIEDNDMEVCTMSPNIAANLELSSDDQNSQINDTPTFIPQETDSFQFPIDILNMETDNSIKQRNIISSRISTLKSPQNLRVNTVALDQTVHTPLPLHVLALKSLNKSICSNQNKADGSSNSELRNATPYEANSNEESSEVQGRRVNKKTMAKILRNSGLQYTSCSAKHDIKPARSMGTPCGSSCRLKCAENISEDSRKQLFRSYWGLGCLSRQRDFIASSITEVKPKYQYIKINSNRKPKHAFYLTIDNNKIRVCKFFYKSTLGINDRPIRTVIDKMNENGIVEPEKRGKHDHHGTKTSNVLLDGVRNHINSIPRIESHYLRKQTTREFIDGGKNLADLYRDYKEECIQKGVEYVRIHTYRKIFKEDFNISFFVPKKDLCDLCCSYENAIGNEKERLGEKYRRHLIEKEQSRQEKNDDKLAINDNNIVACYDLQAVLPVPRGEISVFYYKSKLNCYNFTISELKTDTTECFFWHETEGLRGANEIGTCVYKYLEKKSVSASNGSINVILYSDNCCGQQKNQFMISMYIYAVKNLDNIHTITHKFLIKGHTQNEGDATHSTIEKQVKKMLKSGPIYVPDQYIQAIRQAKKNGKKYNMNEMGHREFFNIKKLSNYKFTKNTEDETVKITDLKIIMIEKFNNNHGVRVFYKTSYLQEDYKEIKLSETRNTRAMPQIQRLYSSKLPLAERKKADLQSLINSHHIPLYYASSFYNNLW